MHPVERIGPWVAGVDGCRGGWIVVLRRLGDARGRRHRALLCETFEEVVALEPRPDVVAVDMPIGLLDAPRPGGRECDRLARRLLGPRAPSVFTPPSRAVLDATSFDDVRGRGLNIQGFHILPKVREVDRTIASADQDRVFEAHPELAFRALAGRPMAETKRRQPGREERLRAMARAPDGFFRGARRRLRRTLERWPRRLVTPDDVLDAMVLTWTAARLARGEAACIPEDPPVDARGLRMEIRW
ncbi:MAG: DUF429 domain-containing protein [Myxococcota bacterium]